MFWNGYSLSLVILIALSIYSCLFSNEILVEGQSLLNLGFGGLAGIEDVYNCFNQSIRDGFKKHPHIGLTLEEVIKVHGYPVEKHEVTTEDGYILNVYRIPYSAKSPAKKASRKKKKAVYLNHGMGGNGQQWILQWGDRNLGFLLADSGFDVFLSNARGTKYSMGHVNESLTDAEYWDFSWDEMGRLDVPAVMNMIVNVTGNNKMYYIGHSMGTTQFLVAMSEKPELNLKIYTGFLLAPSAFLSHSTNLIRQLAPLAQNGKYLKNPKLGGNPRMNKEDQLKQYTNLSISSVCTPSAVTCVGCSNIMFLQFGYDGPETNFTELPLYLSVFPDATPLKAPVHYAQGMTKGTFRKFDYGNSEENQLRYGTDEPKDYELNKISAPVVIMYSENDNLCVPQDVMITANNLPPETVKAKIKVDWKLFTHTDFATAIHARELVYDQIVEIMKAGTYEKDSNLQFLSI